MRHGADSTAPLNILEDEPVAIDSRDPTEVAPTALPVVALSHGRALSTEAA